MKEYKQKTSHDASSLVCSASRRMSYRSTSGERVNFDEELEQLTTSCQNDENTWDYTVERSGVSKRGGGLLGERPEHGMVGSQNFSAVGSAMSPPTQGAFRPVQNDFSQRNFPPAANQHGVDPQGIRNHQPTQNPHQYPNQFNPQPHQESCNSSVVMVNYLKPNLGPENNK